MVIAKNLFAINFVLILKFKFNFRKQFFFQHISCEPWNKSVLLNPGVTLDIQKYIITRHQNRLSKSMAHQRLKGQLFLSNDIIMPTCYVQLFELRISSIFAPPGVCLMTGQTRTIPRCNVKITASYLGLYPAGRGQKIRRVLF